MNAVEIAIKMETDAVDFYTAASGKVKNKVGQKMFLSIANHGSQVTTFLKLFDNAGR